MMRFVARLLVLAAFLACAALLFVWSGIFNIAASSGHFPLVGWFLHYAMQQSVATHTITLSSPPLDEPALIRRGAGHYDAGCKPCHGAPGEERNPIATHMTPHPPFLLETLPEWEPKHLFWIVKNGVKFTGMPAWPAQEREDEVWAMTAFLGALQTMSPERYASLTSGGAEDEPGAILPGGEEVGLAGCVSCHGEEGTGAPDGAFPRLDIQSATYLERALRNYADGLRPSGFMEPQAANLENEEVRRAADFFAGGEGVSASPAPAPSPAEPELIRRGEAIARGTADPRIPACSSCHGLAEGPRNPAFPTLAGQYPNYIVEQLHLFKSGVRAKGTYARIMAPVAEMLDEEQMRAAAAFYASLQPAPTDPAVGELTNPAGAVE